RGAHEVPGSRGGSGRIHATSEAVVDHPHALAEPAGGQLDEEVMVVPEQRPGERDPTELPRRAVVEREGELVLLRRGEQWGTKAPAAQDVVVTLGVDRRAARHSSTVARGR